MSIFRNGQKLTGVYYDNSEQGWTLGRENVIDIEVVVEAGQMSGVPWARISILDKDTILFNLAMASDVRYKAECEQ
jgi:hypothetical protein